MPTDTPETPSPLGDVRVVILAGGRGARLAPLTSVLPKPLMPIGDRAIIELLVSRLVAAGAEKLTLCVGYLSHLIRAVLNDGSKHGIEISYVTENVPLGTAAPLRLVPKLDNTFLVMNGDVLTTLDFAELVAAHRAAGNTITIATHSRRVRIDYGVLHHDEDADGHRRLTSIEEKPELPVTVSMGIYVLEPRALEFIPEKGYFDFPHLVEALLAAGEPVGVHVYEGLWYDIGRREDYEEAALAWESAHPTPSAQLIPQEDTRELEDLAS